MPLTDAHKEIQKLTQAANDPGRSPAVRLLAARKLLRDTNFSARSVRVAKRVAKLFMHDEPIPADLCKKATSLLEFSVSKQESDEDRDAQEVVPAVVVKPSDDPFAPEFWTIQHRNRGWDAEGIPPKKYILYHEPADLPEFGIPADPDLAWTPARAGQMLEIQTDAGGLYYVWFGEISIGGKYENKILNPRYVAAFKAWKSSPRGPVDPRIKHPWEKIFEYEDHFSERARCGCPVVMMWIPPQSFPKPGVQSPR
jgi:hypothetical protein